jgi:hypothetical protein
MLTGSNKELYIWCVCDEFPESIIICVAILLLFCNNRLRRNFIDLKEVVQRK